MSNLLVVLSAPIGLVYVPGKLIVFGNATATANNIRASEWLFRIGIASELIHQVIFLFVVLALYQLFKAVNETYANITVVSIFWGLWLFPFGMLVIRSGFIPRVFGVLLMIAGVGNVADSFATLVLPRYAPAVSQVASPLQLAELPIVFWLLIWGARKRPTDAPPP